MAIINNTRDSVIKFLKETLNASDVKVIKITKTGDGWEAEAEVYEESSFIKALGLPTRVQDRNVYSVQLSDTLEVLSYERRGQARLTE